MGLVIGLVFLLVWFGCWFGYWFGYWFGLVISWFGYGKLVWVDLILISVGFILVWSQFGFGWFFLYGSYLVESVGNWFLFIHLKRLIIDLLARYVINHNHIALRDNYNSIASNSISPNLIN